MSELDDLLADAARRRLPPPPVGREQRERYCIPRWRLAKALGVHPSTLERWERGFHRPTGEAGIAYAEALRRLAELDR